MDTCSNCGATLRPGAKFCTTCGTRLNTTTTNKDGWGTPREATQDDPQETSMLEAVAPPEPDKPTSIAGGNDQHEHDRWTAAYSSKTESTDDPASRFISALEDQAKPAENEPEAEESSDDSDPASTWVTPPPEAFKTPEPVTWSYQASADEQSDEVNATEETSEGSTDATAWRAPYSWRDVGELTEEEDTSTDVESSETNEDDADPKGGQPGKAVEVDLETDDETDIDHGRDAAGFRDGGTDEVDYLSGDENIAASEPDSPTLDPDDARARAISLVDELRRMVRMMPTGGGQDHGAAAMALTEASLNVNDFDDVRDVINELQDDPRDIQALSNLAKKADKIELLLDEHVSLVAAIESALSELSG